MKNLKLRLLVLIAFMVSVSNFTYAQHDHGNMKNDNMNMKNDDHAMMDQNDNMVKLNDKALTKAYMHYAMIDEALVEANAEKAQSASKMLVGTLKKYGKAPEAEKVASEMASKSNIMEQRLVFSELTTALEPLFKENIVEGEIYKAFCPMANGGSYWFSNSSEIKNPYMDKAMSSCGSVKETFKPM